MQQLTRLVQSSSILNAQEKAEWLSLMGLMNDKQLSELEEILKSSNPADVIGPKSSMAAPSNVPSLSHLSNLPNRMVDPRLNVKPAKSNLPNGPEKDFAAGSKLSPMSSTPPPAKPVAPAPAPKPKAPLNFDPETASLSTPSRLTVASPILSAEAAAAGLKLMAMTDVAKLTAEALHHQNRANFFATISALAEKEGYFSVLSHFEKSPLYQDYLNYGKLMLSGANGDNLPLSQEEFEFVADLLQALKINRV